MFTASTLYEKLEHLSGVVMVSNTLKTLTGRFGKLLHSLKRSHSDKFRVYVLAFSDMVGKVLAFSNVDLHYEHAWKGMFLCIMYHLSRISGNNMYR